MAKTESKVGVGIVGCGFVAHMKHLPALKEIPEAEIVSVFDFNAGRAQEVAENFGAVGCKVCTDFEEVIRDPNVDPDEQCHPFGVCCPGAGCRQACPV